MGLGRARGPGAARGSGTAATKAARAAKTTANTNYTKIQQIVIYLCLPIFYAINLYLLHNASIMGWLKTKSVLDGIYNHFTAI